MAKKLQVFISSTFTDLREERQAAVEGVLLAKHIPAGMELFRAGDATQLEVIKQWIDECDAYMLILGGRYGSVEPETGFSYTEIEYDYAATQGKATFALVLSESAIAKKRESGLVTQVGDETNGKLQLFRDKVLTRISSVVDGPMAIKLQVVLSLNEIEKRSTLLGWVKASEAPDVQVFLTQMKTLSDEIARLQAESKAEKSVANQLPSPTPLLEGGFTCTVTVTRKDYQDREKLVTATWLDTWKIMAMKLLAPLNDDTLNTQVAHELAGLDKGARGAVKKPDWENIQAKFIGLGFVTIDYGLTVMNSPALFWNITTLGRQVALAVKTGSP